MQILFFPSPSFPNKDSFTMIMAIAGPHGYNKVYNEVNILLFNQFYFGVRATIHENIKTTSC